MDYLTYDELRLRDEERLPRTESGAINAARCRAAISDASALIRTYLPSLLDSDGNEVEPPARIRDTLRVVSRDLSLYFLNERPGEEDATKRYERSIKLLEALAGGSSSPGSSLGGAGMEALDDDSAALVDGAVSQFLKPQGRMA